MNTGFYKDLDTNFEQAYELCGKDFSHNELISLLKNGNIPQKQIAALKFDYVKSKEDAEALLNNLTGCDGKIREAIAMKIFQLISANNCVGEYFTQLSPKVFADATIDINANICRLIVDSVVYLDKNSQFVSDYVDFLVSYTIDALDELDKFIFRDKKYVINKQLFKLYWCLESLKNFYDKVDFTTLESLLKRSIAQNEYTVREKAAQIIQKSGMFIELKAKLMNDENYYVRAVFMQ